MGIYDLAFTTDLTGFNENSPAASNLDGATVQEQEQVQLNLGFDQLNRYGGTLGVDFNNSRFESNSQFAAVNPSYRVDVDATYTQPLLRDLGKLATNRQLIVAREQPRGVEGDLRAAGRRGDPPRRHQLLDIGRSPRAARRCHREPPPGGGAPRAEQDQGRGRDLGAARARPERGGCRDAPGRVHPRHDRRRQRGGRSPRGVESPAGEPVGRRDRSGDAARHPPDRHRVRGGGGAGDAGAAGAPEQADREREPAGRLQLRPQPEASPARPHGDLRLQRPRRPRGAARLPHRRDHPHGAGAATATPSIRSATSTSMVGATP